jgi:hypothetical protein
MTDIKRNSSQSSSTKLDTPLDNKPHDIVDATPTSIIDAEKQEPVEAKPDTYLHGVKLAAVFVGLALAIFVIVLDQTVCDI